MAVRFKIRNTQRVEVIINKVAVRTTAGQIREGLGRFTSINNAAAGALDWLEQSAQGSPKTTRFCGIVGTFGTHDVQLDLL